MIIFSYWFLCLIWVIWIYVNLVFLYFWRIEFIKLLGVNLWVIFKFGGMKDSGDLEGGDGDVVRGECVGIEFWMYLYLFVFFNVIVCGFGKWLS